MKCLTCQKHSARSDALYCSSCGTRYPEPPEWTHLKGMAELQAFVNSGGDEAPIGIYTPYIPLMVTRLDPATGKSASVFYHDGKEYQSLDEFYQEKQVPPEVMLAEFDQRLRSLAARAMEHEAGLLPELESLERGYPQAQQAAMTLYGDNTESSPVAGLKWQQYMSDCLPSLRKQVEANG